MPVTHVSLTVWIWTTVLFRYRNSDVINVPTTASSANTVSEYILFTHTQRWNTARRVCRSIGASLARVDSQELLDKMRAARRSSQPWDSAWGDSENDVWTGLHRQDPSGLVYDGLDGCSSWNLSVTGSGIFQNAHDYQYETNNKNCLQIEGDSFQLEKRECWDFRRFICEKRFGSCPYRSVGTSATIVPVSNGSVTSCQSVCNQVNGCYMTGHYYSSHCVILTVPPGPNVMYEKNCEPVFSANTTSLFSYGKPEDNTYTPAACVSSTGSAVSAVSSNFTQIWVTAVMEGGDICPSSSISYVYTATSSQECSSEGILMSPSVVNVTVTETSVVTLSMTGTITTTKTVTEVISASPLVNIISVTDTELKTSTVTKTATATTVLSNCASNSLTLATDTSCAVNTQVVVTHMTSTFLMTSIFNCPSRTEGHLTITPSCAEASVQLQPTTVTFYEKTSCMCNSQLGLPSGVIAPSSTKHDYTTSDLSSEVIAPSSTKHDYTTPDLSSQVTTPSSTKHDYTTPDLSSKVIAPSSTKHDYTTPDLLSKVIAPSTSKHDHKTPDLLSKVIAPSSTKPDNHYQTTICKEYNVTNTNLVMIDAILESIANKLTVEKQNLSKSIREKISVQDPRPSSMGIGYGAVAIILIPFLVILLLDVQRILEDMRNNFINIKYSGNPSV